MKVSVPACAPPTPPETGASTISRPLASAAAATSRAVSTSMVEESISSEPGSACATNAVGAEIDFAHLAPRRQHGDDDVGLGRRGPDAAGRLPAGRDQPLDRLAADIERRSPHARP